MYDVVIAGAGPAGAIAGAVLARAGARVALIDRARFPRHKLCGDTLNPGVLALLRRLDLGAIAEACGVPIAGMILTGEDGTTIEGRYPAGMVGRAVKRSDFDWALVRQALDAGVDFIDGTTVLGPVVKEDQRGSSVVGLRVRSTGGSHVLPAVVTIGADGRRSRLAFSFGLLRHPRKPRRWAVGMYAERVDGMTSFGEMHIRNGYYIGVAPLPNGLTNVCLVKPAAGADPELGDPFSAVRKIVAADRVLSGRFSRARFISGPTVVGPLAVEAVGRRIPDGLLLAGDAAGFIDPMTGDGLRFAIRGGELAATAALTVLAHGWDGVHRQLATQRRLEFGGKQRFNRALRGIVSSPAAVRFATASAPYLQPLLRTLIYRAGDCDLADCGVQSNRD